MRIRTIKPEFWANEKLSSLPEITHLFAAALLNYADDEGFFNANPLLIKAAIFPLREPSVTIRGMLESLSRIGYIKMLEAHDKREYGKILGFLSHQVVNKPSTSRIAPLFPQFTESSMNPPGTLPEDSHWERKGKEGKGKERNQNQNQNPPTPPASPGGSGDEGLTLPFKSAEFIAAWELWKKHQREHRRTLKPTTIKLQFAMLAGIGEARAIAALTHSTEKGYQGIFEPKLYAGASRGPTSSAEALTGKIEQDFPSKAGKK